MPEKSNYPAGAPIWVDLAASDLTAAREFYGALFGWESEEGDPAFGGYTMFRKDGRSLAGVGPVMAEGQPVAWSTYLSTDDADKTAELVSGAGGQVLKPPTDIPGAGRMAVFADPTGAAIGVWQAQENAGMGLINEPGTYCWSELSTRDTAAATAFYTTAFPLAARTAEFDASYTLLEVDGDGVAGIMAMPAGYPPQVPAHWATYFAVDGTDDAVAKATSLGAVVRVPAFDTPAGRTAVLADPQGAVFAVITLNPDFTG